LREPSRLEAASSLADITKCAADDLEIDMNSEIVDKLGVADGAAGAHASAVRAALRASLGPRDPSDDDEEGATSGPGNVRGRTSVAELLVVTESATEVKPEMLADEAVTELYSSHYRSLVRLAVLLVRDEPTAEEVVQECFIAMHDGWHRLRDQEKALSYLKQAVVNRSRSVLRHRSVIDRNAPKPAPDMPSAEQGAISLLERSAVITALRGLPDRQRQALVLRYYADLSEAQIAEMMGISKGAVKSHTARGMSSLRAVLEQNA
jgi:RNA polymerase sigma-70 factor (sigma-E family)